jgi:hypothetical protein
MRARSLGSQFRTPDFDQDDRLAALRRELCHFEKFIGLLEAFDKPGNYPRFRIVQQIAGEIREIEVGLISAYLQFNQAAGYPSRSHPNAAGLDDREIASPIFASGDQRGQP